jgi:hypothetical protein
MAHAQKPDFVFRRIVRVHLNRQGRQFSRLLAAEMWASAMVMLDTPCSELVWRVLDTYSIRLFPLHLPSRASPCAITFQLESTWLTNCRQPALNCLETVTVFTLHIGQCYWKLRKIRKYSFNSVFRAAAYKWKIFLPMWNIIEKLQLYKP